MGDRRSLAPGAGGLIFGGLAAGPRRGQWWKLDHHMAVKRRAFQHLMRPNPVSAALGVTPRAENRAAHPNMGGPVGNRGLKIAAHPHRQTA